MSVTVDYRVGLTVNETLTVGVADATAPTIAHDAWNVRGTLGSATTPPVTKTASFAKALVAGAGTIDLTALSGTNGATVDGTGLKVQALRVQCPSTNTNPVIIQPGASNGYNIFGASSKIQINPGEELLWKGYDKAAVPDVAAGAKNIGLTDGGTGTDSCNYVIVLG